MLSSVSSLSYKHKAAANYALPHYKPPPDFASQTRDYTSTKYVVCVYYKHDKLAFWCFSVTSNLCKQLKFSALDTFLGISKLVE